MDFGSVLEPERWREMPEGSAKKIRKLRRRASCLVARQPGDYLVDVVVPFS
jgi:hypothetical protein